MIEGSIVVKTKREVVVNIGYKSEGVISISEFRYDPDLKQGDKIEVYVENPEDKTGQLVTNNQPQVKLQFFDNKVIHKKELTTLEL